MTPTAAATAFNEPLVGLHHNNPPSEAEIVREKLDANHADLVARRDALLAGVARAPETISDDATCGRVADFVKQLTAHIKTSEAARTAAKEPYLSAGRAVDAYFKGVTDPLDAAKKTLSKRMDAFINAKIAKERREREEAARLAREEAERQERELMAKAADMKGPEADVAIDDALQAKADADRAAREASAKSADLGRTRGDLGGVATARTTWEVEVLDIHAVPLESLRPYLAVDAVERAIRAFVRAGGRSLPGVRIYEDTRAVVR